MRRKVPFLGEEHITRGADNDAQAKKARGNVIDELLSTEKQPTTWDDLVVSDNRDSVAIPPKAPRSPPPVTVKPARSRQVPVTPGPNLKKPTIKNSYSNSSAGLATIDWLPINNGHSLRINICGNLDQNLRSEWRKLMEETAESGVGQFEFNLTQAPNLTLTGLGMLLLFKEKKGSERGDIKLCHCNKDVWQLLQWTGMDKYFTIQGIPGMDSQ